MDMKKQQKKQHRLGRNPLPTEKSLRDILMWDEAIGSRLIEMSRGNVIEFPRDCSNNYRLRNIIGA